MAFYDSSTMPSDMDINKLFGILVDRSFFYSHWTGFYEYAESLPGDIVQLHGSSRFLFTNELSAFKFKDWCADQLFDFSTAATIELDRYDANFSVVQAVMPRIVEQSKLTVIAQPSRLGLVYYFKYEKERDIALERLDLVKRSSSPVESGDASRA